MAVDQLELVVITGMSGAGENCCNAKFRRHGIFLCR